MKFTSEVASDEAKSLELHMGRGGSCAQADIEISAGSSLRVQADLERRIAKSMGKVDAILDHG